MESKNMQDGLGWVIKEEYYLKNITAVYENFLGFYKLSAYITHYKRYRVRIWLDWKRCSCFFNIICYRFENNSRSGRGICYE